MTTSGSKTPLYVFFALGFTAQMAQLVLIRELLATLQGNEIAFCHCLWCLALLDCAGQLPGTEGPFRS